MFINPSLRLNNAISSVLLDTSNNELYENGVRIATQTDTNTLQTEIDELGVSVNTNTNSINSLGVIVNSQGATINSLGVAVNTNTATINSLGVAVNTNTANISTLQSSSLVTDTPLVIPTEGSVFISDGVSSNGTNASGDLIIRNYGVIDVQSQLNCNDVINIQSSTAVACTLSAGVNDFTINNGQGSRTVFVGSSSYDFDNTIKIGSPGSNLQLLLNGNEITPSSGSITAGMLRALNINQIVPTVAQTYDIVWSNLTPAEQAIWAGGSEPPIAGVNNSWGFQKLVAGTQKINWTLPFDFLTANLSFQDLQSVYAIVRLNTSSNISAEGYMWFQIQSQNIVPDPPLYRTRWNYANSASGVISQLGNTYKIYASDAIPLSTAASNTGKAQEVYPLQTKFKSNPVDVEPTSLFSIPFTKFVMSPTGDTTAGYTTANVQSIALNTASNISSFDFSVLAIGFNEYRWNLFFA